MAADAVLPTLDAGNERLYRIVNRPYPGLSFERLVEGLVAFRSAYTGKLWIEVMLVKDLNDTEEELQNIADTLDRVAPDEVHISLPIRPPAEPWVQPADEEGVMRAAVILGSAVRVLHPVEGQFDLGGCSNVVDAVMGIITRHPMREKELVLTLGRWTPGKVSEALSELMASGRAQVVRRYGQPFWSAALARYSEKSGSPSLGKRQRPLQETTKPEGDRKETTMQELAVNVSSIPWEPAVGYHPGTLRKVLRRGAEGEPMTMLLKLPPGFEMSSHSHLFVEHHYVLEGEYESQGKRFPGGSYRVIPKHADHGPFRSANGATVFVFWTD